MGTNRSSETKAFAEHLRSQRRTTQAQVDRTTAAHDVLDFTADERMSSRCAHRTAAAAAH